VHGRYAVPTATSAAVSVSSFRLPPLATPVTDRRVDFQALSTLSVLGPGIFEGVLSTTLRVGL